MTTSTSSFLNKIQLPLMQCAGRLNRKINGIPAPQFATTRFLYSSKNKMPYSFAGQCVFDSTQLAKRGNKFSKTAGCKKVFKQPTLTVGFDDRCDFNICNLGTSQNAQMTINLAISALPKSGGKILLREGVYNITDCIQLTKNSIVLEGTGNATVLKRTSSLASQMIYIEADFCKVTNCQLEGNSKAFFDAFNCGIMICGNNNCVTDVVCNNNGLHAIYCNSASNTTLTNNTLCNNKHGICIFNCHQHTVTKNLCSQNTSNAIVVSYSTSNTITENTCTQNYNAKWLYIDSNSHSNTVQNNIM